LDKKPFGKNAEGLSPFRAKSYIVKTPVQTETKTPDPFTSSIVRLTMEISDGNQ
jgi:hypothetical protein